MGRLLRLPLYPLAWLFAGATALRNRLYDWGLLKVTRLDRPVISVGNLSMGGTGKSPVVGALLDLLRARGLRPAVLSRGYGRLEPERARRVDPDGDWRLFGDEPSMLARAHRDVPVCVGPARAAAAAVLADDPPDVYVVDDGFQHRALARDLDLVLLDAGQGLPRQFPVGLFREGLGALRRAHAVLLTRAHEGDAAALRAAVARTAPALPVLEPVFHAATLRRLDTGEVVPVDAVPGGRVAAYAGIAHPHKFQRALEALGLTVVVFEALGDHRALDEARRETLLARCKAADLKYLVTTEKDAVKLDYPPNSDILLCSLSLTVHWPNEASITRIIDRVTKAEA